MVSIAQLPVDLQEQLDRSEARERQLQAELDFERRLWSVSNAYLSPTQKLVMWATRRYISILYPSDNLIGQEVELYLSDLALLTGLSTKTIGKVLAELALVGLIERRDWKERLKSGQYHTHIYVTLTMLSLSPENIYLDTPRNHGGERQHCKRCGSDKLVRRTVIECKVCGCIQADPVITPVNPPDLIDDSHLLAPEPEPTPEPEPIEIVSIVAQSSDVPAEGDEPTEKRRAVLPTSYVKATPKPVRPPLPIIRCKFCNVTNWTWYSDDNEYVCVECYSPARWSEKQEREP